MDTSRELLLTAYQLPDVFVINGKLVREFSRCIIKTERKSLLINIEINDDDGLSDRRNVLF